MSKVQVGISTGPLKGTHLARRRTHDPLEASACVFSDGDTQLVLISIDLMRLSVPFCDDLRGRLSRRCRLPAEAVIVHCTHTHTSPSCNELLDFGIDSLADVLSQLVNEAISTAEPASVAYAEVETGRKYNVNRRRPVPRGFGSLTMCMGFNNVNGDPDGGWLNRARLGHWLGREIVEPELLGPMIYNGPTDGLVQAIFFRTLDGKPVGSIVRYSAHPCTAGHTTQQQYSADFPGVVRARVAEEFGGPCCFLTGPCGNIAPWARGQWPEPTFPRDHIRTRVVWLAMKDHEACWGEVARIGNAIADEIIPRIPEKADFARLKHLRCSVQNVVMPVRTDVMESSSEALELAEKRKCELVDLRGTRSFDKIKRLADRISFLEHHEGFYGGHCYLSQEQCHKREVRVDLPAVALNDVVLLGLPGESFWQTAQPAFQTALSKDMKLVSFTEANGDIGYIPTEAERAGGDYECNRSIIAPGGEAHLAGSARLVVQHLRSGKFATYSHRKDHLHQGNRMKWRRLFFCQSPWRRGPAVIPAQAGIHEYQTAFPKKGWIPACAGMTRPSYRQQNQRERSRNRFHAISLTTCISVVDKSSSVRLNRS